MAALTAGDTLAMSKVLPGSMPIFFICAMIGWSVRCGRLALRTWAAYVKNLSPGMASTCILGGVFISTLGSVLTSAGLGVRPHSDRGVTFMPAWISWTAS